MGRPRKVLEPQDAQETTLEEVGEFKETSEEAAQEPHPDAVLTERERMLRDELLRIRNEQGSLILQLQKELQAVKKKTGVKERSFRGTEEDGIGRVGADFSGKVITSWRMKEGTGVELTPEGRVIDTQTVVFTNIDGKTAELPYRQFYRMLSSKKVPCRIKGYLRRDEEGFYRPATKYRPDDLVTVMVGRYDGDPSDGVVVYDGEEMQIAYKFLNP